MSIVEISNLYKKYSPKLPYAIEDINIYAEAGEIIGLVGKNGVGKSTILKSLTGMHPYDSGVIKICDFDLKENPIQAKSSFGYVPDVAILYENMTGLEYLNFVSDIYGVSTEDRKDKIQKFNDILRLDEAINVQIKTYSHGMRQKISIMGALIHDPRVFILDEPLTGLDPQTTAAVKKMMLDYKNEGNTVIFSCHMLDVVEQICQRIYIIDKGKVIEEFSIEDFKQTGETLEEHFLKLVNN